MGQSLGLISYRVLAEGGIFELLGPLLIFGIYALASVAKKWASSQNSDSDEKPSPELQKAVREKYKEIHARQTGKAPVASKVRSPQRQPKSTPPILRQEKFERPAPIRQVKEKQTAYPVQIQRQRPVRQVPRTEPRYRPKTAKAQIQKPVHATKHKNVTATKTYKQPENISISMIRQPQNLRSAIILKEILDKPVSLRDTY